MKRVRFNSNVEERIIHYPPEESDFKRKIRLAFKKVKVSLILGHTASRREEITSDEKTHDWKFYVRGEPGTKVESFIDRVIFTLHESFPNPIQTIKHPPYEIVEQGYGTFLMQVEVKFKNKRTPKSIHYKYDLLLPGPGLSPIKKSRKEILTFTNPNPDFLSKLVEGGGQLLTHYCDVDGNVVDGANIDNTNSSGSSKTEPNSKPPVKTEPKPGKQSSTQSQPPPASPPREKHPEKKHKSAKRDHHEKQQKESSSSRKESSHSEKKKSSEVVKVKESKRNPKPLSSVLASIGDIESSDEDDKEKYFRDDPPKAPPQPKSKPKEQAKKKQKHQTKSNLEQSFLEFDKIDSLKQSKKPSKSKKQESIISQKRKRFLKRTSDDENQTEKERSRKRTSLTDDSDIKTPPSEVDDTTEKWCRSPGWNATKVAPSPPPPSKSSAAPPQKKNKHKLCKTEPPETTLSDGYSSNGPPTSTHPEPPKPEDHVKPEMLTPKSEDEDEAGDGEMQEEGYNPEIDGPLLPEPDLPMSDEEIILRLGVYQKMVLLQRRNKKLMSEVVNFINDQNVSITVGEDELSFDLMQCDIETLRSINSILPG